ncbi:tRNA pseudouridine(55) synthase TruB [Lysinimonas soli]|uniref:tRNA pseudouridine synthase B n=1 Tax=Lysinimonas soli TaxID=1074233 RepID=A0ABW0NMP7_9MICO
MSEAVAPAGGILLVDKPAGMTSHDVVARARRALGTRKIGHAGTLDPMATGLLVLGVGSSTRLLSYLVGLGKQYTATIRLGQASTTDDAEGELADPVDASGVTRVALEAALERLRGPIEQVPSTFSAIKVDGRRSYDRARSGEEVVLAARAVTISRFEVLDERRVPSGADSEFHDLDVVIDCSSGTYVRALARDLGSALGVGGHLTRLRRTSVGPFLVADAAALDGLGPDDLRPPAAIARELFPAVTVDREQLVALSQGKRVAVSAPDGEVLATIAPSGALAGLVSVHNGVARVLINFPTEEALA